MFQIMIRGALSDDYIFLMFIFIKLKMDLKKPGRFGIGTCLHVSGDYENYSGW